MTHRVAESAGTSCALDGPCPDQRVARIRSLNRDHLRSSERQGLSLILKYAVAAKAEVEELKRREKQCCGVLDFRLAETTDAVQLVVTVPDAAGHRADELLAPLLEGSSSSCPPATHGSGPAAGSALGATSVAIIACGACCLLPIAFPALALGATGGLMAWLGQYHAWFAGAALLVVAAAWGWLWRASYHRQAKHSRITLGVMATATAMTGVALAWPTLEGPVMRILAASC